MIDLDNSKRMMLNNCSRLICKRSLSLYRVMPSTTVVVNSSSFVNNKYSNSNSSLSFSSTKFYSTATETATPTESIINEMTTSSSEQQKKRTLKRKYELKPVSPLLYPVQSVSSITTIKPNGGTENLPFHFERTASGRLPVYSDLIRSQRAKETVLRKYSGDVTIILQELRNILGEEVSITQNEGTISIRGDHSLTLLVWLTALGF
ncbi:hypothetical protein PPL_08389 [Heterostelium album PN500]|uniref:Large ribosomal subunit protein mL49 n=1 Tax=Heterostelium pallidum (strain ATCC 26659 / Pp 5 / PN500) TaxID=670386 RepID=D3BI21_HETP5|nr:hypothetical protein PPL_08389 [Heterostelium album PN500]EFA78921.1 hypothetical protein PPL_08389 [Heterostelium album PN500]|eukprot:XP_020431045.1 hypothetical protein PPL_08389 [Heterostelium album PN500]